MLGRSKSWSGTSHRDMSARNPSKKHLLPWKKQEELQEELFTLMINAKLQSSQRFKIMEVLKKKSRESRFECVQSLVYNTKKDA